MTGPVVGPDGPSVRTPGPGWHAGSPPGARCRSCRARCGRGRSRAHPVRRRRASGRPEKYGRSGRERPAPPVGTRRRGHPTGTAEAAGSGTARTGTTGGRTTGGRTAEAARTRAARARTTGATGTTGTTLDRRAHPHPHPCPDHPGPAPPVRRPGPCAGEPVAAALLPGRLLRGRRVGGRAAVPGPVRGRAAVRAAGSVRGSGTGARARTGTRCGRRRAGARGRAGALRVRAAVAGDVARRHRRTHHDRRDGTRAGDVDPDARRQRRLGLRFLGPGRIHGFRVLVRAVLRRVERRILAGSVRRRTRGVRGSAAALGPGGRTVSFTTQSRFSRLAPPPVLPPCRRPGHGSARAPPYWPPPSETPRPGETSTRASHLWGSPATRTWHFMYRTGRCGWLIAAPWRWWRRSQRRPCRRA